MICMLAKIRYRRSRDLTDVAFVKDTCIWKVTDRWWVHSNNMESLLPTATQFIKLPKRTNSRSTQYRGSFAAVFGRRSVQIAGEMGLKKRSEPDDLPIETVTILASYNMDYLTETINETINAVIQDGMTRNLRRNILVPIFKGQYHWV